MPKNHKQLREAYYEWFRNRYLPVAGGEEPNDDDKSGTGGDDDDKSGDDADDKSGDDDKDDDDKAGDDDDDKTGDDDDKTPDAIVELSKQVKDLTGKLQGAEQAAAKAKKELKEARAADAEKAGDWKKVAAERQAQLEDAQDEVKKANEAKDTAEKALSDFQRNVRVVSIAQRLGYRDPSDAMSLLESQERKLKADGKDEDLTGDDASAERALRKLAEDKKYLVDVKRRTGAPMNGGGTKGKFTLDQIRNMSTEEVAANLDEVNESLRQTPG